MCADVRESQKERERENICTYTCTCVCHSVCLDALATYVYISDAFGEIIVTTTSDVKPIYLYF